MCVSLNTYSVPLQEFLVEQISSYTFNKEKINMDPPKSFNDETLLRVGTDCSGMEAPIVALLQLGIPFCHSFSSEVDKYCIQTIRDNFHPKTLFGDMTKRKRKDIPDIDMYVCGFPCQPFSVTGKRKGTSDSRGNIIWECIRILREKKPRIFVLENVRGLLSIHHGQVFSKILTKLRHIDPHYVIEWKILNTCHYGIPQSRERVYIVGIWDPTTPFTWPDPIPIPHTLETFMEETIPKTTTTKRKTERMQFILDRLPSDSKFVNLSFKYDPNKNTGTMCPTVTAACNLWNVVYDRPASVREYLALQGFPLDFYVQSISDRQFKKQIGNSMSVNVLVHLFRNIFQSL